VTLRNSGGGDVLVMGMRLIEDTASAFRLISPAVPIIVPDGGTVQVQAEFTPQTIGLKTARIEFTTEVGTLYAKLRGVGKKLTVPAFIRRDYHCAPGDRVTISIELEAPVAGVPLDSLDVMLGYHAELLDYLAITEAPINQGWAPIPVLGPDSLQFRLHRPGISLDTGRILSLQFLTRFTLLDSSELPFTIESGLPYLEFMEYPGLFRRDSLCGLLYRLFESSPFNLRLEQNVPNPAPDGTTIEFELPFDNPTTLIVYDILGTERLRLVDGITSAGVHVITIPDGALAAGRYFYRLRSGSYDLRRGMVIE
jgi:hypothetical protein